MKLLVTGTGRTGTVWLTHALVAAGVPARHEVAFSIARHGDVPWQAEVSWLAAPYLPMRDHVHVVHLVRHPLDCIRSRAAWGSFNDVGGHGIDRRIKGNWAIQHCYAIKSGKTVIERAAIHWVRWNEMIHARQPGAELARLEDLDLPTILRWARVVTPYAHLDALPEPVNHAPTTPALVWEDVAKIPGVWSLAKRYGYL